METPKSPRAEYRRTKTIKPLQSNTSYSVMRYGFLVNNGIIKPKRMKLKLVERDGQTVALKQENFFLTLPEAQEYLKSQNDTNKV